MADIPNDLYYTETHEWVRVEDDGTVKIGITDHAQQLLGDLVFVEFPEVEDSLTAGSECAVVESVKAASDVYAPLTGEVVEVNEELADNPALINSDPYGDGWLFILRPENDDDIQSLMDAEAYGDAIAEEA